MGIDLLLAGEELLGLLLANRPPGTPAPGSPPASLVLVAERFPVPGGSLAPGALPAPAALIEAGARPQRREPTPAQVAAIVYREDDGRLERLLALARLLAGHPLRALRDRVGRASGSPTLAELAPVAARLERAGQSARVQPLGASEVALARRLARLSGRTYGPPEP